MGKLLSLFLPVELVARLLSLLSVLMNTLPQSRTREKTEPR